MLTNTKYMPHINIELSKDELQKYKEKKLYISSKIKRALSWKAFIIMAINSLNKKNDKKV